jgi:hypothetical protein
MTKINWTNALYGVTIAFFILGFFNIIFAWLGLACLITPFILLFKDRKKTWCQGICPRASLFQKLLKGRSLTGKRTPDWFIRGKAKWIMLGYFCLNLFVLTMSTIMVFSGRMEPMDRVRFLIAFQLPWQIPQLLDLGTFPVWVSHLSFRIYSMMFTTTVLGLIIGWIYMPRSWCSICPINTLSDAALKKMKPAKEPSDRPADPTC